MPYPFSVPGMTLNSAPVWPAASADQQLDPQLRALLGQMGSPQGGAPPFQPLSPVQEYSAAHPQYQEWQPQPQPGQMNDPYNAVTGPVMPGATNQSMADYMARLQTHGRLSPDESVKSIQRLWRFQYPGRTMSDYLAGPTGAMGEGV